jgi:dentin sialophosphoprotein (fragment)
MAKKQLKKRIFVPTGNDLGEFTIFDLQPVDVTFVDSDDSSQQSSGGSKMGGSNSSIPDPVDNNPLSKGNSSNGSQGSSGGKDANPYANNSGDNSSSDEFSKQDRDLDNDLYGEDLDTDREEQSNNNNSDGEGGSSGDGGSGGSSGGMTSEDNSYAPPNYDGSSNMGDDSSSLDSTSEMEDALNKEQENMSDTAKERASEVSGEGSQSSTSQKDGNSNQQSGDNSQQGGQSQLGDSQSSQSSDSSGGDNSQQGGGSNSQGGEGSQSQDNQAGSGSRGDKGNKPNDDFKKAHDTKGNDLDDTDGKGVVDKIVREAAKRMQEELDKDETLANTNQQSLDNYKDFGAGTMTTLFKGNSMVADWKAKLEKLFRKALGQRITMNPNMINKRIEDAPPGREDIETQMVKVAVLIDCSGSMGSGAFKKVIMQMDAMIKADKQMRNVLFYIIPFEAWSAAECVKRMVKCKGTKLKAELMKFKAEGGTDIVPGVHAMMKKVKNPDSIIILSDCGVSASRTVSDTTYQKWLKKYRDRIIWVLTSKRDIQMMNAIDSYAKKQDRYVVFKGNGD